MRRRLESHRRGLICGAIGRAQLVARSMRLSILLPTHRHDLPALGRIAQACSWAGPDLEVLIRDNSGNAQKRELLERFEREYVTIVFAEPCEPLENYSELLRMAKGEFLYCVADDDFCFDRAMAALPGLLDQVSGDVSVAGVTGGYAVESSKGSSVVGYQDIDSDDVVARITGYLSYQGPNVLAYSPFRRAMVERVFVFMNTMPHFFSFHDQIQCLLYLLNGRFVRLQRLLYLYDVGIWEAPEAAQKRDADFYRAAGLDPAVNKLHWVLCGFEGAVLTLNSDLAQNLSKAQRQSVADRWFSTMFVRFKGQPRLTFDSQFSRQAEQLCAKLQTSTGQLSFQSMLAEISSFFGLFSQVHAQRYFDFWDMVVNRRQPAVPPHRMGAVA